MQHIGEKRPKRTRFNDLWRPHRFTLFPRRVIKQNELHLSAPHTARRYDLLCSALHSRKTNRQRAQIIHRLASAHSRLNSRVNESKHTRVPLLKTDHRRAETTQKWSTSPVMCVTDAKSCLSEPNQNFGLKNSEWMCIISHKSTWTHRLSLYWCPEG